MWWSDRRSLLLALPLLAAGCGFTPVYGPDGIGTTLRGAIIADAPDSQEAYMLVRRLEEKLGRPANPTGHPMVYGTVNRPLPVMVYGTPGPNPVTQ